HSATPDAIQPKTRARSVPPLRVQARLQPCAVWRHRIVRGLRYMPKRTSRTKNNDDAVKTADYRHTREKRTNIPPAKIEAEGSVPTIGKARYAYSPHLPPILR